MQVLICPVELNGMDVHFLKTREFKVCKVVEVNVSVRFWFWAFLLCEHVSILAFKNFMDHFVGLRIEFFDASDSLIVGPQVRENNEGNLIIAEIVYYVASSCFFLFVKLSFL